MGLEVEGFGLRVLVDGERFKVYSLQGLGLVVYGLAARFGPMVFLVYFGLTGVPACTLGQKYILYRHVVLRVNTRRCCFEFFGQTTFCRFCPSPVWAYLEVHMPTSMHVKVSTGFEDVRCSVRTGALTTCLFRQV